MFQRFNSIWQELVTAQSVKEAHSVIAHMCENMGAFRVSWTDRHFNMGRETSVPVLRHSYSHADISISDEEDLEEAYLESPMPPPDYRNPESYYGRSLLRENLMRYSDMPAENRHFHEHLIRNYQSIADWPIKDIVLVPLPGLDYRNHISTVNFMLEEPARPCMKEHFHLAANMLRIAWNHNATSIGPRPRIHLSEKEKRVATWAIAGKTLDEISMITSIPARTVRHYLYSIRDRYGYATVQQMLIRVAKDYNIDP